MIPTIHLNGTSKGELVAEYAAAIMAIENAIQALATITVHGRDYYVQGPNAYALARDEHVEHIKRLTDLQDEISGIYREVEKQ